MIGRRLLYQLRALVATEGDLPAVMKGNKMAHSWLSMTPQPGDQQAFEKERWYPRCYDIQNARLIYACTDLIGQLAERCCGRRLVVLLIMDDGHLFDEYVKTSSHDRTDNGAPCALRFAKYLQVCVGERKRAAVMPLMAGIYPSRDQDHCRVIDRGSNYKFKGDLLARDEFAAMVGEAHPHLATEPLFRCRCDLFFPLARDALEGAERYTIPPPQVPEKDAGVVMMASGMPWCKHLFHRFPQVPAIESGRWYAPFIPPVHFFRNYFQRSFVASAICEGVVPKALTESTVDVGALIKEMDRSGLIGNAFSTLTLLLALANIAHPNIGSAKKLAGIAHNYESCRESLQRQSSWLEVPLKRVVKVRNAPAADEACSRHLPSSAEGAHGAFKLKQNGEPLHPLDAAVFTEMKEALVEKGDCYGLSCGEGAPVDFVWVVRKSAKGAQKVEVALRLVIVKFVKEGEKVSVSDDQMPKRFVLVANYLHAAMAKELGMTARDQRYAVLSNGVESENYCKQSMTNGGCAQIRMLNKDELRFSPLTDILFGTSWGVKE